MNALPCAVGPYRLTGVAGRGRRSIVYHAIEGNEPVALKVCADRDLAGEHDLMWRLRHPALVAVRAHGRSQEGGWLAMEYAERGALPAGPVGEAQAREWLRGAATALAHLHAQGWVHRDVKPANLLRRADGSIALADFGEAVPAGHVAAAGTLAGAPAYAAPEQLQGAPAAPAADIYSLGIVLHGWLAGGPAFPAQTLQEALAQHLLAPVPRLVPALAHWQPLLEAMLAKRADSRPRDGAALLEELTK